MEDGKEEKEMSDPQSNTPLTDAVYRMAEYPALCRQLERELARFTAELPEEIGTHENIDAPGVLFVYAADHDALRHAYAAMKVERDDALHSARGYCRFFG